jgi:hypothetical protein
MMDFLRTSTCSGPMNLINDPWDIFDSWEDKYREAQIPGTRPAAPIRKGNPCPKLSAIIPLTLGPKKKPIIRVVKKKPKLEIAGALFSDADREKRDDKPQCHDHDRPGQGNQNQFFPEDWAHGEKS